MKAIKKVAATPLPINEGKIIDSFSTSDDKHINAPSISAVENYVRDNLEVVDSNTLSNNTKQTYSGRIVDNKLSTLSTQVGTNLTDYAFPKSKIVKVSTSITTTTATQSLMGLSPIPYPTGFTKANTFVLSARIGYSGAYYTRYVTPYDNQSKSTDTILPMSLDEGIYFQGRLPELDIGTTVSIELILMRAD